MLRSRAGGLVCLCNLLAGLAGCVTGGAGHSGVVGWVVSGDDELLTDTPPQFESEIYSAARRQVRLRAALNETLSLQIGLRAEAPPAGPFDVSVCDLVGPQTLPAASAISLFRVQFTRVETFRSWYPGHTGRPATPRLFPDILVPWNAQRGGGPITLAETRNEIIWLDVHVPPTIAPGVYHGTLAVRAPAGSPLLACDVELEVLPVAIPGRRSLPVLCRIDPGDLLAAHLRWPRQPAEEIRLLPDDPSHLAATRLVGETMRLFHEHRTNPLLWAAFPRYRLAGDRRVEIDWDQYDRLVTGWVDGSAFADRARLEAWALPVSLAYPDAARNGGFDSLAYARLLAGYVAACRQHFAERGWLDRAVLRVIPPAPLSGELVERTRRLAGIVRQSEAILPLVAHLPARSLRGLGWHDAPAIELPPDVNVWAPPAMWYEVEALARERTLGRRTWLTPDQPPYSPALGPGAPAADPRTLPWLAYRVGATAVWLEHAAEFASAPPSTARAPWCTAALIYPGDEYGVRDRPLASVRLKRLLRGLQDFELLRLLEDNGKQLAAQRLAEQVVRWAATDAATDNLLHTREAGWSIDPQVLELARMLMLDELAGEFAPGSAARQRQIEDLARWGRLMSQAERVAASFEGVRLALAGDELRATVLGSVLNTTNRPLQGRWSLPSPPPGWREVAGAVTSAEPGTRRTARLEYALAGFAYNIDGIYPLDLAFDTPALGALRVPARLAVAVCPVLTEPPVIDGRLEDWGWATSNQAGDFRLVRYAAATGAAVQGAPAVAPAGATAGPGGPGGPRSAPAEGAPALPTKAFF
ncbi:MAG: hypothetical protein AB1716_16425, partial [Planctomycetota bacterium]